MVIHDFICSKCNEIQRNMPSRLDSKRHSKTCSGVWEILWNSSVSKPAAFHKSESTVVYYSPQENKIQYPMRNDVPTPARLVKRGYQRMDIRSDAEMARFEKTHGVMNERRHYDRNGKQWEDEV